MSAPHEAAVSLAPGRRLGPYEIVAPLGAGGMGEVFRARDTRLGRDVAIKVLPEAFARDPERRARFERGARAVAALSHPHIVALHDFGEEEGTAYAVTELLDGETLRVALRRGPLPGRKAVEQAVQIARGLAAAHENGIVHRDLKPENVFVTTDGQLKILDFGLARQEAPRGPVQSEVQTLTRDTAPGVVLGTVGYMSPEQVQGLAADHRSDVFALGCVLYEMLTGRRAFERPTAAETMTAILREDPPALSGTGRPIPSALERTVHRCLEKTPTERFQSARRRATRRHGEATPVVQAPDLPARAHHLGTVRPRRPHGVLRSGLGGRTLPGLPDTSRGGRAHDPDRERGPAFRGPRRPAGGPLGEAVGDERLVEEGHAGRRRSRRWRTPRAGGGRSGGRLLPRRASSRRGAGRLGPIAARVPVGARPP